MRRIILVAAALATLAAPALAKAQNATPPEVNLGRMTMGYTYFNRPGADLKTHDDEVVACAAEAARTVSFDEQLHTGMSQGVIGMAVGGAIQGAAHRGAAAAGLENCMVVRGWRVVKLADEEGQALARLAPADLAARLAPWVGAADPHGQIVRVWGNDAANAASIRYAMRPDHTNDGQLSLTEATTGNLHQFALTSQPLDSTRAVLDPKWPRKALAASELAAAPDGSAIILVRIKGLGFRNGIGLWFSREGTANDIFPSRGDHAPDLFPVSKGLLFAHHDGDMFAYAVPPGRWRVSAIGMTPSLSFCLGAPSFPVEAGEVVFAGSFDLGAADLGPDLDLAPAKAWLSGRPQARAVRPAVYRNGSRGLCGGNGIYALEVKGAPFEPGYAWGSLATGAIGTPTSQSAPAPQSEPQSEPQSAPASPAPPAGEVPRRAR